MKALQESTSWKPPDISTTHGVGEAESEDAASKLVVNPDGTVGGPGAHYSALCAGRCSPLSGLSSTDHCPH